MHKEEVVYERRLSKKRGKKSRVITHQQLKKPDLLSTSLRQIKKSSNHDFLEEKLCFWGRKIDNDESRKVIVTAADKNLHFRAINEQRDTWSQSIDSPRFL